MSAQPADTLHVVETPEGARIRLAVAGPIARGLAWVIDLLIRAVVFYILVFALAPLMDAFNSVEIIVGFFLILIFLMNWLYSVVFESLYAATPGKMLFKLRVVHDNAAPLTIGGSVVRNLLRAVDGLPFLNALGLVCMMTDSRFRRLGDLAAGTLVIYKDKTKTTTAFEHPLSMPPPAWLSRDDRQAIVDFAERSAELTAERQAELAEPLHSLMDSDADPVTTLKCWAQWILRGQNTHVESTGV
ncbi:MAG: RDD family protein [Gammaproteobacteria bacterium]|nr:RDD family protein [Gammaproteobacteria bacterium]